MDCSVPAIRCRQIDEADIAAVTALLVRGFPNRTRQFWSDALAQLSRREPPPGFPKYGYLLESGEVPVGTLLLICSTICEGGGLATRCNLSSWYVEPAYRAYATLLVSQALGDKDATYTNVSAAPHTWPIIEAQGFSRYCDGVFVAVPMLKDLFGSGGVRVFDARQDPTVSVDAAEQDILHRHAEHGCISLWCEAAGRAYPFVFRPRLVKRAIPCAQLIYCRDVSDFVRFAGPIGRYLARRGQPFVIIDSNGAIPGLVRSAPAGWRNFSRARNGRGSATSHIANMWCWASRAGSGKVEAGFPKRSCSTKILRSPAPCTPQPANAADRGRGSRTVPGSAGRCRTRRSRYGRPRRIRCADSTSCRNDRGDN